MTHRPVRALATAFLTVALSCAVQAQEKDTLGGTPTDAGFFKNATASGLAEVQASQLALKQASSAKVKSFAQRMVADHTKADDELKSLKMGDKGYPIAHDPLPESEKRIDALSRLHGADFDREYAKLMVADHEKAVAIFEVEIEKGSNDQLKAFAKKTLPTLKDHLKQAKTLP
jgi:putative membrane protein